MQQMQSAQPPEVQFINELLARDYPGGTHKLLTARHEELTPDFLAALRASCRHDGAAGSAGSGRAPPRHPRASGAGRLNRQGPAAAEGVRACAWLLLRSQFGPLVISTGVVYNDGVYEFWRVSQSPFVVTAGVTFVVQQAR